MKDSIIRPVLKKKLEEEFPSASLILDELAIHDGKSRIDMAVLETGIHGFEIKGSRDNIKRLKGNQCERISRTCRTAVLVTAPSHIWHAQNVIPEWWGIWSIEAGAYDEDIELEVERYGEENPEIDPFCVCQCFWKDELISILGLGSTGKDMDKNDMARILADTLPLSEIYTLLEAKLLHRPIRDNRWGKMHGLEGSSDKMTKS